MIHRFGQFELDEEKRELRRHERQIAVQPLVFDLLTLLVRNHRRVVSKDEIMGTVWPDVIVTEASLQRAISLARSALDDTSHDAIRTFTGRGYRFCVEVSEDTPAEKTTGPRTDTVPAAAPRIQYAKTSDGVRIAYSTAGSGEPFVWATDILTSHVQREWDFDLLSNYYRAVAGRLTLVRFDARGVGLSDRAVEDLSLEARVRDLDAVVTALQLDRFVLNGEVHGGPVAVLYAARYPEKVSKLILEDTFVKHSQYASQPHYDLLGRLLAHDWEMYTENIGSLAFGWAEERAREYGRFIRDAITRDGARRAFASFRDVDITDLLPRIRCPTLVVWHSSEWSTSPEWGRDVAALIADAHVHVVEAPWGHKVADFLSGVGEYLGVTFDTSHLQPEVAVSERSAALRASTAPADSVNQLLTGTAVQSGPHIQYTRTADGVSVAFSATGRGPALIHMLAPGGHIQQQWEVPEFAAYYRRVAERRMLVHYDIRGTGLSQRDVSDFSLPGLVSDLQAVADRLALERFALWATTSMGPVAVSFAASHPERVSHLILWCSYARPAEVQKSSQAQALRHLIDDWELYTDTLAHYFFGWPGGEPARRYAARMREGVPQQTYRAIMGRLNNADVTDLLPQVAAPTLVLHRRQFPLVPVEAAKDLAARLPDGRLVVLSGESAGFALEDWQSVLDAVNRFLA